MHAEPVSLYATVSGSGGSAGVYPLQVAVASVGANNIAVLQTYPATTNISAGGPMVATSGDDLGVISVPIPGVTNNFAPFEYSILKAADDALANYVTLREGSDGFDGVAAATGGRLFTNAQNNLFNGATWDRLRSASAANQSAQPVKGVLIAAFPGNWTLTSAPLAATAATATRAAGGAGVRHILTSVQASVNAVAAIGTPMNIVVRDGASGVGPILWQDRLIAPAGADSRVSISALAIVGSVNTAMTVEFTAAPPATDFQTLSATGYDVS